MMSLTGIVKIVEEVPTLVGQYLMERRLPFEATPPKPAWYTRGGSADIGIQCGSVKVAIPQIMYLQQQLINLVRGVYSENGAEDMYVLFHHIPPAVETHSVVFMMGVRGDVWDDMFNAHSVCDVATKLGPTLYSTWVRDTKNPQQIPNPKRN